MLLLMCNNIKQACGVVHDVEGYDLQTLAFLFLLQFFVFTDRIAVRVFVECIVILESKPKAPSKHRP